MYHLYHDQSLMSKEEWDRASGGHQPGSVFMYLNHYAVWVLPGSPEDRYLAGMTGPEYSRLSRQVSPKFRGIARTLQTHGRVQAHMYLLTSFGVRALIEWRARQFGRVTRHGYPGGLRFVRP